MKYVGIQTQIRRNNTRSVLLLILFPVLILAVVWILYFLTLPFWNNTSFNHFDGEYSALGNYAGFVNREVLAALPWVILVVGVWFIVAYFSHSSMIRNSTHSRPLLRKENKRVYNLVENLCIECGMRMPQINIIDDDSLNAFASGINEKTFSIALSKGVIEKLDDEELKGVIAHELTHIQNRDVRLLIISIVFVGIFSFILSMARTMIRSYRPREKDKGGGIIVILIILLVASIAYFISSIIRFSISRKREFLADAGAAQLTKNPLALASALRKIAADPLIEAVERRDVAQLFIEDAQVKKQSFFQKIYATHPPIETRIRILEEF